MFEYDAYGLMDHEVIDLLYQVLGTLVVADDDLALGDAESAAERIRSAQETLSAVLDQLQGDM